MEKNFWVNEKLYYLKDKKIYEGKICIKIGYIWFNVKYLYV